MAGVVETIEVTIITTTSYNLLMVICRDYFLLRGGGGRTEIAEIVAGKSSVELRVGRDVTVGAVDILRSY